MPPNEFIQVEVEPGCWLSSERALYLSEEQTLVIADIHWGYAQSHRRAGNLLPLWGDEFIAVRLDRLIKYYQPVRMIWVGDSLHTSVASYSAEKFLNKIQHLEVVIIAGNHDRAWSKASRTEFQLGRWFFHHGDKPRAIGAKSIEVIGHIHPAISWSDGAGLRLKLHALIHSPGRLILPSFSEWSAGTTWNAQLKEDEKIWLISPRRIWALNRFQIGGASYDTQSLAEAVHGLTQKLGYQKFFLGAHDVGAWVAYPLSVAYSENVRRLVLLEAFVPGATMPDSIPVSPTNWKSWHFAFHAIPDLPEILITGREREYVTWFLRRKAATPSVFTEEDIDEYVRIFTAPGGLRAGLAYYRTVFESIEQNKSVAKKLEMPVLAFGGEQGSAPKMAETMRTVARDVRGGVIPNCGHYIPEEVPDFLAKEMLAFFAEERS